MHDDLPSLIADLESMRVEFSERGAAKQAQLEETTITDPYGKENRDNVPDEFVGAPYLVVPYARDDDGQRPIVRRPDAAPPLRSVGVDVRRNGQSVSRIDPGETYRLTATVENQGDLDTPPMPVEFFVRHEPGSVTLDPGKGPFEFVRDQFTDITGYTTYPPGTTFRFRFHSQRDDPNAGKSYDSDLVTVAADRTFSTRVYVTPVATDPFYVTAHTGSAFDISDGDVLGTFEATFTDTASRPLGPLPLEGLVSAVEFVDYEEVRHTEMDAATADVDWTAPSTRGDTALTSVFVRSYSMSPPDLPDDFGTLDHTRSRLVGRTERNWRGVP
ncbi:MAG: hypothetical protein ACQETI_07405 [Halobacteriota archaeon]